MTRFWTLFVALFVAVPGFAQSEDRPAIKKDAAPTRPQLDARDAQALYGWGLIQRRSDRLLEAVRAFEESVRLDPEAIAPRRALVPLYLLLGRDEPAEAMCKAIVARDPADYETWLILAGRRKDANDGNGAVDAIRKALESPRLREHPDRELIFRRELAVLLDRYERFAEAEQAFIALAAFVETHHDTLIRDTPLKAGDADQVLAQCYERAGRLAVKQKRFTEAVAAFQKSQRYFAKLADPTEASQAGRLNWNLAEVFIAQEHWEEALAPLDRYLASQPSQIEAYERKIEVLKHLGRAEEVVPALRGYAGRDPNFVALQLLLGRELGVKPETRREAEKVFLKVVENYTKPEVYRALFVFYRGANRVDEILNLIESSAKVVARKDGDGPREERDGAAGRLGAMMNALQSEPEVVAALLRLAASELRGGRSRESGALHLLGSLAARTRQSATAEALLRQALFGAPPQNALNIYFELLPLLREQCDYTEMIRICREALNRPDVNQAYFHYEIASAYAGAGQFDDALRHADQGVKLSSDAFRSRNRANRSRILTWAGRHEEALAEAKAMLDDAKLPGEVREARIALSSAHNGARQFAKSEEQLRLMLELDPGDALANNNLGYEMADQGRNLGDAEKFIRKAVELDRAERKGTTFEPENAAYLDSLGWVLFRQGKYDEARKWLERAAALADGATDPTVSDHLGDTYLRLGEEAKARESWAKALQLYRRDKYHPTYAGRAAEIDKKLQSLTRER